MSELLLLPPRGASHGQCILVVDDEEGGRLLLSEFLEVLGYRVLLASDGYEGVHKAQILLPDAILMDVRMPGCDGITACRLLKATPATCDIPVIFLTAATLPEERVAGLMVGAVDYISRPFDLEELRLRLCIHLRPDPNESADDTTQAPILASSCRLDVVLYQAARARLLENLADPPGLQALAASIGTNAKRLNAAFKQCVGVTVFDYLRELRMKTALRLLSDTTLEVQQISDELGYGSAANFATAFRQRFGLAPSQFRKDLRSAPG
ncbi:response regulator transcription factor [Pandoraea sputorum]|uniref:response regulator transcription factor n=1 Tax=Pandoraea sputorum TaxID=93222 RepID=UPI001241864B|nr:DNA-binding response regulator [Pandoraea sputorum]